MSSAAAVAVASLCGVAAACILLTASGVAKPAPATELLGYAERYPEQQLAANLPARAQMLGPKAASYVRRWSEQAAQAAMSPKEQILALKAQGVPVIFPSKVTDASGNLNKMFKPQALAAMQKPAFNMVPAGQSSKLACKCGTCTPLAGFPPVCTGCACEEAMDDEGAPKEDVFMIGHTKACAEDKCEELETEGAEEEEEAEEGAPKENPVNSLLDFPECEWWSCYDKEGWFCACTCPGQGCI